ncbi:DUF4365 domain-containing protein [Chitinophaga sedimenti]|uniref:DUF4365 domain-containing protein n=1 Tax=Chitinophaga sedimenti TaxID=2033606 RepID=UPI002003317B|nr:DUF4365 domain-containing protein [Chitinophaga sedimenti]MCK7559479.1 DUF4365 domain-containing protein [Chitinophaga sedimenti]
MAFGDSPTVDRFSENEDESNSYFTLNFSERNGFLASKPKDKGCDFIVELINEHKSTNWWIPVQIKSIESPTLVDNGTLLSYQFETSRLQYMLRPILPVGLIIIYSVGEKKLYYDFAENIYKRLLEERNGDRSFHNREHVNIHIPLDNLVGESSVKEIHSFLIRRHQNVGDYSPFINSDLPTLARKVTLSTNAPSLDSSINTLKERGDEMFNNNEIPQLMELLEQVEWRLLREDPQLGLLAGITYWATGMRVDASFFL